MLVFRHHDFLVREVFREWRVSWYWMSSQEVGEGLTFDRLLREINDLEL